MDTHRQVVLGIDQSASSTAAVDVAVNEAVMRKLPLRIVHAFPWPTFSDVLGETLRQDAELCVRQAVERAHRIAPRADVTGEVATGFVQKTLIGLSHDSALIVLGDHGLGAVGSVLAGSVAVEVAEQAACPVLIARGATGLAADIVLGVDGSPANDPAIGFAFGEAALRGCAIDALHVWAHPVSTGPGDMIPLVFDPALVRADETRLLAESLAGWQEQYPEVVVRRHVAHGHIRPVLIEASGRAGLIVVGARGLGSVGGLLLGSVSQAVLHHAACPVAIVPHAPKTR